MAIQFERSESDLQGLKMHREDSEEFEQLSSAICSLKTTEMALFQNIDELKGNPPLISNKRDELREQISNYANQRENLQKILCEEIETDLESAAQVILV